MIVAIDGPAGAGKSTVARRLAERLDFRYLDTGAMYRALTWLALRRGVSLEDEAALAQLARAEPVSFEGDLVLIAGHDVTIAIRQREIDHTVPSVARQTPVRAVMRERQRELAAEGDAVIEGRDIGAVVVPDAEVKVYLIADEHERAKRRSAERPGVGADDLAHDLRVRDASDRAQTLKDDEALEIDTTELTVDEVVDRVEERVRALQRA